VQHAESLLVKSMLPPRPRDPRKRLAVADKI
jgi:hypothetical protein